MSGESQQHEPDGQQRRGESYRGLIIFLIVFLGLIGLLVAVQMAMQG